MRTEIEIHRPDIIDTNLAHQLGGLVDVVYGGTYYEDGYTGNGRSWIRDSREGAIIFIARDSSNQVVGTTSIFVNKAGTAILANTVIKPELQGKGLGKILNTQRIEWVTNAGVPAIVENRAHVPPSFMFLLKNGFTPIALTPDDALPSPQNPGSYLREYYLLSWRGGPLTAVHESIDNPSILEFLNLWNGIITTKKDGEDFDVYYKNHEWYGRLVPKKGALVGVFSLNNFRAELCPDSHTINLYFTSIDNKVVDSLNKHGFQFNGVRPWLNLYNADGRRSENPTCCFWVFSRVSRTDQITKPNTNINLQGINQEIGKRLKFLYNIHSNIKIQ
jgi:predicted GNAT family acetyltransferase